MPDPRNLSNQAAQGTTGGKIKSTADRFVKGAMQNSWVPTRDAWSLVSLDTGQKIQGQYRATGVSHEISADWASRKAIGRSQPVLQYVSGEQEVIKFQARVFGHSSVDDSHVVRLVNQLRASVRPDPDLNRPHIWELRLGNLSMTCIIKSVGGVSYDRIRPDTGEIRGAVFSLVLWRYDPYGSEVKRSQAESLVVPWRGLDSFERITQRLLGDASVGEALRRRNPKQALAPAIGTRIHVPPLGPLRNKFRPTPQNAGLADNLTALAARRDHADRRGVAMPTYTLPAEWDGL